MNNLQANEIDQLISSSGSEDSSDEETLKQKTRKRLKNLNQKKRLETMIKDIEERIKAKEAEKLKQLKVYYRNKGQ